MHNVTRGAVMYFPRNGSNVDYDVVILFERSRGNAEVGEMWIETRVFPKNATLDDVIRCFDENPSPAGRESGGRMFITIPTHSERL